MALGTLGFILTSSLLGALPLTRGTIFPLAAAVCAGTAWLVRRLPDTATLKRAPASPLILATRAGASVLTVVTVTSLAHLLGPKWSGLVAGFPVNGLPVMAILHYQYGADVTIPEKAAILERTAEIASVIAEGAFYYLDAPVKRMGAMDVPVPFSPVLEDLTVPSEQTVFEAARALCRKA